MSKLNFKISYKDACIIQHILMNYCEEKQFNLITDKHLALKGCNVGDLDKKEKELQVEINCLNRFVSQLNNLKQDKKYKIRKENVKVLCQK